MVHLKGTESRHQLLPRLSKAQLWILLNRVTHAKLASLKVPFPDPAIDIRE